MFVDDAFARFAKVTILLSAAAVLLIASTHARTDILRSNTRSLVNAGRIGMMMMVSAGPNLMALYMGPEAAIAHLRRGLARRRQRAPTRGGPLKIFILGALLGPAALRRLAGLWLRGQRRCFRHHRETADRGRDAVGLLIGAWSSCVAAGLTRSRRRPSQCESADVYERARRSPSTRFRHGTQWSRHGPFRARRACALGGARGRRAADSGLSRRAFHVRLVRVAAIGQTDINADGLYSWISSTIWALPRWPCRGTQQGVC